MPGESQTNERLWAMLCHLLALLGFVGIPMEHLLGPLVLWLALRKDYPLVDQEGREAVNFQISMTIYTLVAVFLMFVLIGFVLLPVVLIANLILVIVAGVRVHQGESYRYPWNLRLLKP